MSKFAEAEARLFKNVVVCRRCKRKMRAPKMKIMAGKIKCNSCKSPALRPLRRK